MKHLLLPAIVAVAAFASGTRETTVNPALLQVKAVYILPMTSGFDQYLASHLTQDGVFDVVTDPQKADAILTDRVGEVFERRMEALYPPPPEVKEKDAKDKDAKDKSGKSTAEDKAAADKQSRDNNALQASTFGRNRGTLFLVDRRSRNVIWSLYERPKDTTSKSLDRSAEKVAKRIQTDRNPPQPKAQ